MGNEIVSLEIFARGYGMASMVTRWREAHPKLVGMEEDVVAVTVRELREAPGGQEWFEGGTTTGLLMFKRRRGSADREDWRWKWREQRNKRSDEDLNQEGRDREKKDISSVIPKTGIILCLVQKL